MLCIHWSVSQEFPLRSRPLYSHSLPFAPFTLLNCMQCVCTLYDCGCLNTQSLELPVKMVALKSFVLAIPKIYASLAIESREYGAHTHQLPNIIIQSEWKRERAAKGLKRMLGEKNEKFSQFVEKRSQVLKIRIVVVWSVGLLSCHRVCLCLWKLSY